MSVKLVLRDFLSVCKFRLIDYDLIMNIINTRYGINIKYMGFINKIFGGTEPKEEKVLPWIALTEVDQLDRYEEKSKTKTQVIFKHSTRCGISRMVMNQFVDAYDLD